ncbi:MAG: MBL fold metallo-hydrolase, partial [Methylococcales bacterium]|nr:MBL fold metallo-hydrolase [Methylococcales bacterium]
MQIHSIDLEFQGQKQVTGAYFIDSSAGGILIETGPATTLPALLTGLDNLGVKTADIKHVLVTHIHFDHAGASGWWAQQGAHIYMHHFGAPHMVNPARLVASATRIYGDQMEVLWGDLLPIPKSQMTALNDNDVIEIGDVTLTAWDTPGHAWHHHCYVIDDIAFTGDVAAVKLPNSHLISLPAPPPDFHRERWLESLDRVQAANFRRIYLTHFGAVDDVSAHLDGVR